MTHQHVHQMHMPKSNNSRYKATLSFITIMNSSMLKVEPDDLKETWAISNYMELEEVFFCYMGFGSWQMRLFKFSC